VIRVQEELEEELDRLGIEVHDADKLAREANAYPPLFDRAGQIVLHSGAVLGRDGRWRSVGGADAIHVALAERSQTDYFATCDKGFRHLSANVLPAIMRGEYP
jgi:predicted nucleic acid-binding protein